MTTSRDRAEAAAFDRRRRVLAFVSTHPAGRTDEPPRPLRCLLGGLVLAVVVAAATAAGSTLTGHPTVSWGTVLERPSGDPNQPAYSSLCAARACSSLTVSSCEVGQPALLMPNSP
jgi:hypothetical protein